MPPRPLNLSEQHKFVLWSLPRTGTRYLSRVLRQFGLNAGSDQRATHEVNLPPEGYQVLCLVRNPFTRVLSGWQWRAKVDPRFRLTPFDEYLRSVGTGWLAPITRALNWRAPKVDHKIHLERHREDIQALPLAQGVKIQWPPNPYRSPYDRPAMDYYTPELRERVVELYLPDFEFGGYDPAADFHFSS